MQLSFRCAIDEEKQIILSLYQKVIGDKFCVWDQYYPNIETIEADLQTKNLYVLLASNQIIGAISIVPTNELDDLKCWKYENAKEIARVVIARNYQGNNLSYLMVNNICDILKNKGYKGIHLAVEINNLPAYKTYFKAGFKIVGTNYMYGNSYYLMEKEIN